MGFSSFSSSGKSLLIAGALVAAASPLTAAAAPPALADLRAEPESLNRDTAGGANQERINDLNRRIDELERAQNPSRE